MASGNDATSFRASGTATLDSSATEALSSARALQTYINSCIELLRGKKQEQKTESELNDILTASSTAFVCTCRAFVHCAWQ
jgi:hypothetical protein